MLLLQNIHENMINIFWFIKVEILYSNCSHITFELDWVFILNFGSFFLLLRLQTFSVSSWDSNANHLGQLLTEKKKKKSVFLLANRMIPPKRAQNLQWVPISTQMWYG